MKDSSDPRLAAVTAADGSIDCAAVEALLSKPPSTLTIPQLEAMQVVFDEVRFRSDNPLAHITFTREWLEALTQTTGGTVTRERVRHGEVVERSVRHHRGRADVQAHRAAQARPRARRRGAGRPRATASRSSARSGDSGDDGEGPEAEAARLRGFLLVYLISFDWSSELIDSAYAFSVEIEREMAS